MPADFFIDTARGIVFSKIVGVLDYVTALDHMDRLVVHPDFRPEFNQLFDFRPVTKLMLSHDEIMQLAMRAIFSAHSRRAFVAPSDVLFGSGRVFSTYRELEGELGIVPFKKMSEALTWLSLSEEPDPGLFTKLVSSAW